MGTGDLRWNNYNLGKIAQHGVSREEVERILRIAKRHEHRRHRQGSWIVYGRGQSNRRIRVVYLKDPDGTYFVIHAMPYR